MEFWLNIQFFYLSDAEFIYLFINKMEHPPCSGFLLGASEAKMNNKYSLSSSCLCAKRQGRYLEFGECNGTTVVV